MDGIDKRCRVEGVPFTRNIREGKNYLELVKDINEKEYDLVIIGIRGLGETNSSQIGSVCERVVRRINTDALIVKNDKPLSERVIIAVDGSEQSFRSIEIAGEFTKKFKSKMEALSVFDPHYHRVAFSGITKILSGEMGEIFKSEEQEKLHEDVIDKGLEKIYYNHLKTALNKIRGIGLDMEITLLEGKPYDQILKHVEKADPSLLVIGRTGIHAINGLDMGSATENILRFAKCNVLITKSRKNAEVNPFYEKKIDISIEPPVSQPNRVDEVFWDKDARSLISRAPSFVKGMVVEEVENYARSKGSNRITQKIVEEVKAKWSDAMG